MLEDDVLAPLPPLADDGELTGLDLDDDFSPDESEIIRDDAAASELPLGALIEGADELESMLDDRVAELDELVFESSGPESGFLDDAPMELDLGVPFERDDHRSLLSDSGLDGLDEPEPTRGERDDDDVGNLPPLAPGSDGEGLDEPIV